MNEKQSTADSDVISESPSICERWRVWLDRNVLDLGRQMRISYVPPLMVYLAAGVSGLTGIVGTFFFKEYLGLSAEFLAALSFWTMLPWALKMPMGHLVDLLRRYKAGLIYLGAGLIAASLLIMINLLGDREYMAYFWSAENWCAGSRRGASPRSDRGSPCRLEWPSPPRQRTCTTP